MERPVQVIASGQTRPALLVKGLRKSFGARVAVDNVGFTIAAGEIYQAVESDHALHLAIARSSGNRFLAEAVSNLNCGSLRLWYTAHERLRDQTQTPRHSHLIDALRSRDPERAAEETRKHIMRSYQRQLTLQAQHSIEPLAATAILPPGIAK